MLHYASQTKTSLTRIMLDNMVVPLPNGDVDVSMLKEAVNLINGRFETEVTNILSYSFIFGQNMILVSELCQVSMSSLNYSLFQFTLMLSSHCFTVTMQIVITNEVDIYLVRIFLSYYHGTLNMLLS